LIICTDAAPPDKMAAIRSLGAELIIVPDWEDRVDLAAFLSILGERRINSLLVEGGAEVHGAFFAAGLVDKFHFFLAPKFIGGRNAPGILGGHGIANLKEARQARKLSIHRLGPDILISGYLGNHPYSPCTNQP
jgi:diaminohydroxyphosphoribosylaminopyrimidine deaminase/5-amino-6-(5-phosphoribosylamino)uracil reductase